jgi:hypothetical protein
MRPDGRQEPLDRVRGIDSRALGDREEIEREACPVFVIGGRCDLQFARAVLDRLPPILELERHVAAEEPLCLVPPHREVTGPREALRAQGKAGVGFSIHELREAGTSF